MIVVRAPLSTQPTKDDIIIEVAACRRSFAKLRWRGVAPDGVEFGFDLKKSLCPGDVVYCEVGPPSKCYVLVQEPEPILEIPLSKDEQQNRSLAWQIGNLHFPLQVHGERFRTADDPAIRQMLDRLSVHYHPKEAVFQPLAAVGQGHSHGHGHHHHSHDH